ncbi:hypothetical protein F4813DRAFT_394567 [Daldinia decipiens]|uniref:uncharacterized protein n=1 Tax=Daldinia decipiens TaxID=326647 RepID=UPI0020C2E4C2|nr:uncharacterized protein F4813DRAFT_394567 [Daldinia decipiens]KAI1652554.1 hypothetical protein F4813DRAFT_394567 [Daldinia decipiens]
MYRTVTFWEPTIAGYQRAPIPSFIRSVLSSPVRASMVTLFAVTSFACAKDPKVVDFNTFINGLREAVPDKSILELWEKHLFNYTELLDDRLLPGCVAFLAVLCLPRLKIIFFSDHFSNSQWDLLRDILEENRNRGDETLVHSVWPMLDSVIIVTRWDQTLYTLNMVFVPYVLSRTLTIIHDMHHNYYTSDYNVPLAMFALLPGVNRLQASWQVDPEVVKQPSCLTLLPLHSTELEELILQPMCNIHSSRLDILLRVPKNLRIFKFQARALAVDDAPFELKWLDRFVCHQSHSLEHISLTHKWYEEDLSLTSEIQIEPMSFSNFVILKTIEISPAFVFGSHVLQLERRRFLRSVKVPDPSTLSIESTKSYIMEMLSKSIEISRFAQCYEFWDARRLDRALVELLRYRDERFPNLNTIEIHIIHSLKATWRFGLPWTTVEALSRGVSLKCFRGGRLGLEHIGGEDLGKIYPRQYEGDDGVYQAKELDDSDFQEREEEDDGDDDSEGD